MLSFGAEWTLYEQVAVAAMDCQRLDVARVRSFFNNFMSDLLMVFAGLYWRPF
jgi:hypothetical protein